VKSAKAKGSALAVLAAPDLPFSVACAVPSATVLSAGIIFVLATAAGAADVAPVGKDDVDRFGEVGCGGEISVAGVTGELLLDSSSATCFSSCSMRSSIQRSRSVSGAGESGFADTDFGGGLLISLSSASERNGMTVVQSIAAKSKRNIFRVCLNAR